jgi:hypothetical protein
MMKKKNREKAIQDPPRPLLVLNDKGGEKLSIESLLFCSASALSAQTRWNRFPDLGGTGFGVSQYPFWQANSVAPSFQNRWHRFWLLNATGLVINFS